MKASHTHSKAASHSHENGKPAALPLLPNNAELKGYSIIGAVGLEVKTREKTGKSSQFDRSSSRAGTDNSRKQ
jgi:hypothetical protein